MASWCLDFIVIHTFYSRNKENRQFEKERCETEHSYVSEALKIKIFG